MRVHSVFVSCTFVYNWVSHTPRDFVYLFVYFTAAVGAVWGWQGAYGWPLLDDQLVYTSWHCPTTHSLEQYSPIQPSAFLWTGLLHPGLPHTFWGPASLGTPPGFPGLALPPTDAAPPEVAEVGVVWGVWLVLELLAGECPPWESSGEGWGWGGGCPWWCWCCWCWCATIPLCIA